MGFRTSDPQRMRWVKVATEMSSLVSMLFRTFLNPLKFLMEIFNILVSIVAGTDFRSIITLLHSTSFCCEVLSGYRESC